MYNQCIDGNKMVDWLIKNDKAAQRLVSLLFYVRFQESQVWVNGLC